MNKTLQTLFCFCAAAMLFCSCAKEEPEPNTSSRAAVKLRAVFADSYSATNKGGAKVVVDNTVTPAFLEGDEVWVSGETFTATVDGDEFTLTGSAATPYAAVYPYDCVDLTEQGESTGFPVSLTLPAEQPYEVDGSGNQIINAPMAALADDEPLLEFKNVCSLVRIRVRNNYEGEGDITLSSITIAASSANLSGSASITESEGNFTLAVSSGSKSVTLTGLSEEVKVNKSSKDYYIYIPPISGETLTITVNGKYSDKTLGEFTQVSTSGVSLAKSEIGAASHRLNDCEYFFTKAFSVAADRQVYFSPGNLEYQPSTNTFQFADEQWTSFIGSSTYGNLLTESNRVSTDKWLDRFGWGTSGWDGSGATYYHPYNLMCTNNSSIGYGYGPSANSYRQSLTGDYKNADWGIYNNIKNGDKTDAAGTWRTPTSSEWSYVYGSRSLATSRKARATVNGILGLILLPDNWKKPAGISMTLDPANSTTNVYTSDEWHLLEKYGAVFIPVTGKSTTRITGTGTVASNSEYTNGYYWSSTVYGGGSYPSYAYSFYFFSGSNDGGVGSTDGKGIHVKYSSIAVRLVKDVE